MDVAVLCLKKKIFGLWGGGVGAAGGFEDEGAMQRLDKGSSECWRCWGAARVATRGGELGISWFFEGKSSEVRGLGQNLELKIYVCARLAHLATGGRSALFADPQFDGYMRIPDRPLDGKCACILDR